MSSNQNVPNLSEHLLNETLIAFITNADHSKYNEPTDELFEYLATQSNLTKLLVKEHFCILEEKCKDRTPEEKSEFVPHKKVI